MAGLFPPLGDSSRDTPREKESRYNRQRKKIAEHIMGRQMVTAESVQTLITLADMAGIPGERLRQGLEVLAHSAGINDQSASFGILSDALRNLEPREPDGPTTQPPRRRFGVDEISPNSPSYEG